VNIKVEFGEYRNENGVEKGSQRLNFRRTTILLLLCKTHGLPLGNTRTVNCLLSQFSRFKLWIASRYLHEKFRYGC